ncbi:MAG: DMT family transporter [Alphaproteobacteria bacterium]|nr:DMT family transporter [Alphaproteobacteria bacterium]
MAPLEWGLLIVLSIFWGGSFLFVGIAVSDFQPVSIAFIRVAIATVVLWIIVIALRIEIPTKPGLWASFLILGAINGAIPFTLIAWGQSHIASGLASILIAATPVIAVVAAHFLTTDEPMTIGRLVGVIAGLLGVIVLIGPAALGELGSGLFGQLAIILAATFYALAGIFGRRFSKQGVPPLVIATGQVSASTVLLLPMVLLVDQPWLLAAPSPRAWLAVGSLGIISTAIGYLLYFRVLATAGATNLLLVNFLVPVTAILLGILVLDELLLLQHIGGLLLIAGGLALIDGRATKNLRRPGKVI